MPFLVSQVEVGFELLAPRVPIQEPLWNRWVLKDDKQVTLSTGRETRTPEEVLFRPNDKAKLKHDHSSEVLFKFLHPFTPG